MSGKPIFDEGGAFKGYRGTVEDIKDLVEFENQLLIARDKAQQANKAKSDFLASMSHELRTPLNAIIGFSQLMIMETFGKLGNAKYLEYLKDIERSSSHLLEIINDILDLSRIEAGEADFVPTELHLPAEIETCVRLAGLESGQKQHQLAFHIAEDALYLMTDERVFRQILINILSNAAKYTPDGGKISVHTSRDEETGGIVVQVEDTGAGIAEEDIARVLEPFGQARSGSQITHEGTGLGLSLSSKLMQLAGGKLHIESYLGVGTRVTLSFPAIPTAAEESIAS